MISQRTKAALAAAKVRGVELGRYGRNVLSKRNWADAAARARELRPLFIDFSAAGIPSTREIAAELNRPGVKTSRGKAWRQTSVTRLLLR
jgi:DNA invertase Pin-like site-specific DNA recombinase